MTSPTPNGVSYWRGKVDSQLSNLAHGQEQMGESLKAMREGQEELKRTVRSLEESIERLTSAEQVVTWAFLREKLTVPIILGLIMFVLTTVLPTVYLLMQGSTP